ncbi:MAG: hypothetical protein P9L91_03510 [Candidatus Zophobacter franzmannii]|nr:hypothetical protein [Candidatus Zophobacter franzmannii]
MKKYLLRNLMTPLEAHPDLKAYVSKKLQTNPSRITSLKVIRRSLDARKRNEVKYNFTLELFFDSSSISHPDLNEIKAKTPKPVNTLKVSNSSPFIIGAGPAGLFAAFAMVENGLKPIIFDRGEKIADRKPKVVKFWKDGNLDTESNVQYGEGGAGTFSDGKLTARSKDIVTDKIYTALVEFGADPDILFKALPHLGSDKLEHIITQLREYLESKGCVFHWNSKFNGITIKDNKVSAVRINDDEYTPEIVVLALGNSARDTFSVLHRSDVPIENKDFAIGYRIEHPQDYINHTFYGDKTDFDITGPATYRLVRKIGDRGVFSFCMCPGGSIINGASENGGIVTNGMSSSVRSSNFANSAIVASVSAEDYGTELFAGMKFQQKLEKKSFKEGFLAPIQSATDFLNHKKTTSKLSHSFLPDTYSARIDQILPANIAKALKYALTHWDRQFPGFANEGVLIAPETRTSSPIRILRDHETRNSVGATNLFPVGEGAGYAGGIISSAADGWKTGEMFKL